MYYRRKLLLALLQQFNNVVPKLDFQKYLFLLCQGQEKPAFEFVPYNYGCFSFQSYADFRTLKKYAEVDETQNEWCLLSKNNWFSELTDSDQNLISELKKNYQNLTGNNLIKYVYTHFPYFAINSKIAENILSDGEMESVNKTRPINSEKMLYTIGYEGLSPEAFANILIQKDVKLLIDVRKNSYSMKYGFSKSQLTSIMNGVGIEFLHMPELGIVSDKRQALNTLSDYQNLFDEYEKTTLIQNKNAIKNVYELYNKYNSVALTCFEKSPEYCHRNRIALKIQIQYNIDIEQL